MEEVDKDPEGACETSSLSEIQEAKSGASLQDAEENPSVEVREELWESQSQEDEVEEIEKLTTPQRIIDLQRDLPALVTNIQIAADAKESMRRTELEEARRRRLEQLENDVKSSQEKFEETSRGWSIAKQKVTPQELHEALNNQQQLCAALIEDKKKLINDLQQELKAGDDQYIKDLRRQAEELDLMMERMEDQFKTLTKAYREELAQIERVYQQETEVLLTTDKTEWERYMKELLDKELERLMQRKKKVEEYEEIIHNMTLEKADEYIIVKLEQNAQLQALEKEEQQLKATAMVTRLKKIKGNNEENEHRINLIRMKSRIFSLHKQLKNLSAKYTSQEQQFTKRSRCLSEEYKRYTQQYEGIQKKIKHFAVANAVKFEEMWLMIEAEVKELVNKALDIESEICEQHLRVAWERPPVPFMELYSPIQPQKKAVSQSSQSGQTSLYSQRMMDASVGHQLETDNESTDVEMSKQGTEEQSVRGAEVEEGMLPMETVKKVMELLCDEAGFLMEDNLLNLLAPLEKEEQIVVKLSSLLCSFGIEEEDVPKLALFLLKHEHRQREKAEQDDSADGAESGESSNKAKEAQTNSTTHQTSELIDPKQVVPALKSFLEHLIRSKKSSAGQHPSLNHLEPRDTKEDEAYWESLGNIISKDKLELWDAAERTLKQYHAVLTEVSELVPETQRLEQQNRDLRMLLQQSLSSRI